MERKTFGVTFLLLGFVFFMMTSCATIFTGTRDTIYFDSDPQGATVYLDGLEICTTPCNYKIKRSLSEKSFEVKLDGYETRIISLDREFNMVSILNLGFIPGWAIDAATGAIMKYDRKKYDVTLKKIERISKIKPSEIHIDTKNKVVAFHVIQK